MPEIKSRERASIIGSLNGGVVPGIGLQHIQVGRAREVESVANDLTRIKDGASQIRFIVGEYGSGKSFFLTLCKAIAHAENFVVFSADVTIDRVFCSSKGKARALFGELVKNASHKTKPESGAFKSIVERWFGTLPVMTDDNARNTIFEALRSFQEFVSGTDFSEVLYNYYVAYRRDDGVTMAHCLKWLMAEYETKTAARNDIGVQTIIADDNFYDYLKLYAKFIKLAGYSGLLINIDELAVMSRLNSRSRAANYEMILTIFNDCLQGGGNSMGFLLGGTPEFIRDTNRGLSSYGALAARLAINPFEKAGLKDYTGPILNLDILRPEELLVLFMRIREVFALGDRSKYLIDDEGLRQFLSWCTERMGAKAFLSPRQSSKWFTQLMGMLEQNPETSWPTYLPALPPAEADQGNQGESEGDELDDLADLKV